MLRRNWNQISWLWTALLVLAATCADAGLRFDGKESEVTIPRLRYLGKNALTVEFIVTPGVGNKFSRLISNEFYKAGKTSGFGIGLREEHWMVYVETERGGRRLISQRPIIDGKRVHLETRATQPDLALAARLDQRVDAFFGQTVLHRNGLPQHQIRRSSTGLTPIMSGR